MQSDIEKSSRFDKNTSDEVFGDLLISGLGKNIKWSAQFYLVLLTLAIVPMGAGYFLAAQFGISLVPSGDLIGIPMRARSPFYHVFIIVGIAVAFIFVGYAVLTAARLAKTEIFVYENGIVGLGVTNIFVAAKPFFLPYSDITSAKAEEGAGAVLRIILTTKTGTLTVSSPNAAEIFKTINTKLKGIPL